MTQIELYIDGKLADIGNPRDFGVYLKRLMLSPKELNTEDRQKSYQITIPATDRNNSILKHINIEEVQGKFVEMLDAELIVGGVRIFKGQYYPVEINPRSYVGNLVVRYKRTISDIFGDMMMNKAGKWEIPFSGIDDITTYNVMDNAPCIFPLVLYGLLPKRANSDGTYTDKDLIDDKVLLTLDDIPPSVNVIQMIRKIFENQGLKITGDALVDERIRNLYVSYKNPGDYEMQWNPGRIGINASWQNESTETSVMRIDGDRPHYVSDLFKSPNTSAFVSDSGRNIYQNENGITFIAPISGLYKLDFKATFQLDDSLNFSDRDGLYEIISTRSRAEDIGQTWDAEYNLTNTIFEIKVVRNLDSLDSVKMDNTFARDNIEQSMSDLDIKVPRPGAVHFIDPLQNSNMICGIASGVRNNDDYINPADTTGKQVNTMAISGGRSWSPDTDNRFYSAVKSLGYLKKVDGVFVADPEGLFTVELENAPTTYATRTDDISSSGEVHQIIWLDKGDSLSVISSSNAGYKRTGASSNREAWLHHSVEVDLFIEPFQTNRNWLNLNNAGSTTSPISWAANSAFKFGNINLIDFLPSEITINTWLENFCKVFNLVLSQSGNREYMLSIRNNRLITDVVSVIDLDKRTSVSQRRNEPLGLPYIYNFTFSIDKEEEGYVRSSEIDENGDVIDNTGYDGSVTVYTRSYEDSTLQNTSNFSYCWYKTMRDELSDSTYDVPVITDAEVWQSDSWDYADMMLNKYMDKAQRFWYKDQVIPFLALKDNAKIALVKNHYDGALKNILTYENVQNSLTKNFFLMLANSYNSYTVVEVALSPEEYAKLDRSLIKFNGDLYHAAEIDSYDPLGYVKGTIKLIRRII